MQCKFKVYNASSLTWKNLIDPSYYNNNRSIFERAFDLYSRELDKNFRLILCTSISFDNSDLLASFIHNAESGIECEKLSKSTDKKVIDMISEIKMHLDIKDDSVFFDFLSKFRFNIGKSVHDVKASLQDYCGMVDISFDMSKDSEVWTSLIKKLNLRKTTRLDCVEVRKICINENLFGKKKGLVGVIGIGRTDERINALKLHESCLDLSQYFDNRRLKTTCAWSDIILAASAFVEDKIKFGNDYIIELSSIYSVAYLLGKLIGFKKGNIALKNRNGYWIKNLAQKATNVVETEVTNHEQEIEEIDDVTICVSIAGNPIYTDVADYIQDKFRSHKLAMHLQTTEITNNTVWDFAESVNRNVLSFLKRKKPQKIHLFYRGPAEMMFILGQYAVEWGECQIYDFDFQGKTIIDKVYFEGIKF